MKAARNFSLQQSARQQSARRIPQTGKQNRKPKRCLFYGLTHPVGHTFIDKRNNQCALLPDCGQCKREKAELAVNWDDCIFFNTKENKGVFEVIITKYKVLPRGKAEAVSLKEWLAQVMEK
ncbi:MAG: hypothetical protein Q7R75_02245 [bacterium]|nr:hypothetical protein [bacterium]